MRRIFRPWLAVAVTALTGLPLFAQQVAPPPATKAPAALVAPAPTPVSTGVAATVNGQPITEAAVQRGLKRVPPAKHAEARPEILDFLIDNLLIDQYLLQLNTTVEKKDVDARLEQIHAEIKKQGQTVEKVMQELMLTETEIRAQITADLRWDRYASAQATDKLLRDFFEGNKDIFDGSMVRARHILLTPPTDKIQTGDAAKARLLECRKEIEDLVTGGMAKLQPPPADALAREQARTKLLDEAFAKKASTESGCPSKAQGGDVGWFPRAGSMVEPFAKTAFALKPYQMSDVVVTQFGYHLILATDRRPGKDTKFEDVKDDVKEVYCDRLRESLAARLRPAAKIVITPQAKP